MALRINPQGRQRKSSNTVGLSVFEVPIPLVARIDEFAIDNFCLTRREAIIELLNRGLEKRRAD